MKKTLSVFAGIEIIGTKNYTARIRKSLSLLRRKAPRDFAGVRKHIGRIEDYASSGMAPWEHTPTFYFSRYSASFSVTWCASCIVHDAHHSRLYWHNRRKGKHAALSTYTGRKVELECMRRQIAVSKRIGAPDREIQHLKKQDGLHNNFKGTW